MREAVSFQSLWSVEALLVSPQEDRYSSCVTVSPSCEGLTMTLQSKKSTDLARSKKSTDSARSKKSEPFLSRVQTWPPSFYPDPAESKSAGKAKTAAGALQPKGGPTVNAV